MKRGRKTAQRRQEAARLFRERALALYWESQMLLAGMPADFDFRFCDFGDGAQVEPDPYEAHE
jgi:hypothetical protein